MNLANFGITNNGKIAVIRALDNVIRLENDAELETLGMGATLQARNKTVEDFQRIITQERGITKFQVITTVEELKETGLPFSDRCKWYSAKTGIY